MAVKELKPAKSKFKVKYKKTYLCTFIAFVIVSVVCFGVKLSCDAQTASYKEQIAEVQQKVDDLNEENEENLAVINSTDRSAFFAKFAREHHEYAQPGEYVFYKAES